jgi:hypothetical protein
MVVQFLRFKNKNKKKGIYDSILILINIHYFLFCFSFIITKHEEVF